MTAPLEQPRTIRIAGRSHRFANYADLVSFGEDCVKLIAEKEAALGSAEPAATAGHWNAIATAAEMLADVLEAQDGWLAEHDAATAAEVEDLRRAIRNLNVSPATDEPKGEA